MRNFPHQVNQIPRILQALRVTSEMIARGDDVSDDQEYGTSLARALVYQFRGHPDDVEGALRAAAKKPAQDQGHLTFARDLRRFFVLTGFIDNTTGTYRMTSVGRRALDTGSDLADPRVRHVWKTLLWNMELEADGRRSHPFRILVRLVAEHPGIETRYLALALEAQDDSDHEFQRVSRLIGAADLADATSSSEYQIKNAVKIIPALARQLGVIRTDGDRNYPSLVDDVTSDTDNAAVPGPGTPSGAPAAAQTTGNAVSSSERRQASTLSGQNAGQPGSKGANRQNSRAHRRVSAKQIATHAAYSDDEEALDGDYRFCLDNTGAIVARERRTRQHHEVVRDLALLLESGLPELYEDPYDCLAVSGHDGILAEVKTLDDDMGDEVAQVRAALGQLLYYADVNLPETVKGKSLTKFAVFTREISDQHKRLLQKHGCLVVWQLADGSFSGTLEAISALRAHLD